MKEYTVLYNCSCIPKKIYVNKPDYTSWETYLKMINVRINDIIGIFYGHIKELETYEYAGEY